MHKRFSKLPAASQRPRVFSLCLENCGRKPCGVLLKLFVHKSALYSFYAIAYFLYNLFCVYYVDRWNVASIVFVLLFIAHSYSHVSIYSISNKKIFVRTV